MRLTGQVVAAPRWQNPSVELATLKAVYNDNEIAILVEWDDPFKDLSHDEGNVFDPGDIRKVGAYNSYVAANDMVPRAIGTSAIRLRFNSRSSRPRAPPSPTSSAATPPIWWSSGSGTLTVRRTAIGRGGDRPRLEPST